MTMFTNSTQMLRTQVYDYLHKQLAEGTLKPGNLISCNKIAASLGVGRTPLRDALLQLQAEGFVTFYPQRGVLVREFSIAELLKLYEVCGVLDAQVLTSVFDRMGEEELRQMRQCHETMRSCLESGEFRLFVAQNVSLHKVYLDLCTNDILVSMLTNVRRRLFEFSWDNWRTDWGTTWRQQNCVEHEELIGLIESGKREEAANFLKNVHWSYNWAEEPKEVAQ